MSSRDREDPPTPKELRDAADQARALDDFLDKCGRTGVLNLMGFDLGWLAEQFEAAADRSPGVVGNQPKEQGEDPRVPGIRASIDFLHGFCESHGATDIGRELFHLHREMENWLNEIIAGGNQP